MPARSIPKRRKILVEVSDESKCLLDHRYLEISEVHEEANELRMVKQVWFK